MGFYVRADDVRVVDSYASSKLGAIASGLDGVGDAIQALIQADNFKGEAAGKAKAYFGEVHGGLIASLKEVISEYLRLLSTYRSGLHDLDASASAELDEDTLYVAEILFRSDLARDFSDCSAKLIAAVRSVADLLDHPGPNTDEVFDAFGEAEHAARRARERIGEYELTHSKDLVAVEQMMSATRTVLDKHLGHGLPTGQSWAVPAAHWGAGGRWIPGGQAAAYVADPIAQKAAWDVAMARYDAAANTIRAHEAAELATGSSIEDSQNRSAAALLDALRFAAGLNWTFGTDLKLFYDPEVTPGAIIPTVGIDRDRRVVPPVDFDSLTDTTMSAYTSDMSKRDGPMGVRVTVVRNPGEPPRYLVSIPGTEGEITSYDGWAGDRGYHRLGRGWDQNLRLLATGTSKFAQAAKQAIANAITEDQIAHGEVPGRRPEVVLTGHSQGGIIAAQMAADADFRKMTNVRAVVTYGSPIDTIEDGFHTPVLSLENGDCDPPTQVLEPAPMWPPRPPGYVSPQENRRIVLRDRPQGDPVPALDLGGATSGSRDLHPSRTVVHLTPPVARVSVDNHKTDNYQAALQGASLDARGVIAGFEQQVRLIDFYAKDQETSMTLDVEVSER